MMMGPYKKGEKDFICQFNLLACFRNLKMLQDASFFKLITMAQSKMIKKQTKYRMKRKTKK